MLRVRSLHDVIWVLFLSAACLGHCASSDGQTHRQASPGRGLVTSSAHDKEHIPLRYPVWWHAPFWSGSGYSSEAINYVLSLVRNGGIREEDVRISQHGDIEKKEVRDTMVKEDRQVLAAADSRASRERMKPALIVCHSMPTNWMLPAPMGWAGAKCPPEPREAAYVYLIGRTMLETDKLPREFVSRCNAMNEVWVPSDFSRQIFIASGVAPSKLVIVPEGVNTTHFDPANFKPMPLPQGELVFGHQSLNSEAGDDLVVRKTSKADSSIDEDLSELAKGKSGMQLGNMEGSSSSSSSSSGSSESSERNSGGSGSESGSAGGKRPPPFRFLSTFKWEARKGWDVLLAAYLQEFTSKDNVELYIITKPFMSGSNFKQQMLAWARTAVRKRHQRLVDTTKEAERLAHEELANAHHSLVQFQAEAGANGGPLDPEAPTPELLAHLTQLAARAASAASALPPHPPEVHPENLPTLYVVSNHVNDNDFPRFYKAVDAFVLPSRGEGWGRPHVEAMSMGLPVISTNWSGIQAYLDESVGYPIKVDALVPTGSDVWWFKDSNWAQPSIAHLRRLMRRVVSYPQEAKARGKAARERMVREYSPEALGPFVAQLLRRADARIPQ